MWDPVIVAAVVITAILTPFQTAFIWAGRWGGSLLVYLLDVGFLVGIEASLLPGRCGSMNGVPRAAFSREYV